MTRSSSASGGCVLSPSEVAALHAKFDDLADEVVTLKVDVATIKASMLTTPKLLTALAACGAVITALVMIIEKVAR